jgi:hypothetical protein
VNRISSSDSWDVARPTPPWQVERDRGRRLRDGPDLSAPVATLDELLLSEIFIHI